MIFCLTQETKFMPEILSIEISGGKIRKNCHLSFINNQMGTDSIKNGTSQVGSKVWDWWGGSLEAWYRGFYPRAARTRSKRALLASFIMKIHSPPHHNLCFSSFVDAYFRFRLSIFKATIRDTILANHWSIDQKNIVPTIFLPFEPQTNLKTSLMCSTCPCSTAPLKSSLNLEFPLVSLSMVSHSHVSMVKNNSLVHEWLYSCRGKCLTTSEDSNVIDGP